MHATTELPQPAPAALEHSERVATAIRGRIAARGGWIDFSEYMDLALYAPALGYYSAGAAKFGPAGDFVTAPEISALFGRCLARAIAPVVTRSDAPDVLELGAGTGAMAVELLQTLGRLRCAPRRYLILEPSAELRERQRHRLAERAPDFLSRIEWLDVLPAAFDGAIVANEVLDALPVSCFAIDDGEPRVLALGVAFEDGAFRWSSRPAGAPLAAAVARIEAALGAPLPAGFRGEFCPGLPGLIATLADTLCDGVCLVIDYGLPRRELYSRHRAGGTLTCHYRHRAHGDPFRYPGLQDITAWVDFSDVASAATASGFRVDGYTTQAEFLIAAGIEAEFLAAARDDEGGAAAGRGRLQRSREMQTLLMPGEMGERFKVMWLGKGDGALDAAFAAHDRRHRL